MSVILACDVGTRRTGVALGDTGDGTVMALETISHTSKEELKFLIMKKVFEKKATTVLLGLPLLPGGEEGSQVVLVRELGDSLQSEGVAVDYLDERYTTKKYSPTDGDARAACELLLMFLERQKRKDEKKQD